MILRWCLALSCVLLVSPVAGIGYDHEPGRLPEKESWPSGLRDIVGSQPWVSGYWINGSDTFFYTGDQAGLHDMLSALSETSGFETNVVLHPGPGTATSAYGVKTFGKADWAITISNPFATRSSGFRVRVDIWLGHKVSLNGLEIPPQFFLSAGREIQDFVDKHNSTKAE